MVRHCFVPGCKSRGAGIKFFSVPYTTNHKWEAWLGTCPFLKRYSRAQLENVRICILHFDSQSVNDKLKLNPDAVPKLNLPITSDDRIHLNTLCASVKLPTTSSDVEMHSIRQLGASVKLQTTSSDSQTLSNPQSCVSVNPIRSGKDLNISLARTLPLTTSSDNQMHSPLLCVSVNPIQSGKDLEISLTRTLPSNSEVPSAVKNSTFKDTVENDENSVVPQAITDSNESVIATSRVNQAKMTKLIHSNPQLCLSVNPIQSGKDLEISLTRTLPLNSEVTSVVQNSTFGVTVENVKKSNESITAMSRVNEAQLTKLLDLLSEDGVLVYGKVCYKNTNKQNFWKRVALQLNAMEEGVYKSSWNWRKMWSEWKCKTTKKADILRRKKPPSDGQRVVLLSDLELRLLRIIDYPMLEKTALINMHMAGKTDQEGTDEIPDFLFESDDAQPTEHPISLDEEDNTALRLNQNDDEMLPVGDNNFQHCGESTDMGDQVRKKGKTIKNKKLSLTELKIKSTIALENERVQQKNEELRLRAIELKLRGDELRLKETEMNNINYLTNIEEQKLKCFKEISSSLKELLHRMRY